jgi:signal transduction histidine kinase
MGLRTKLTIPLLALLAVVIAAVSAVEIDRTLQIEVGELTTSGRLLVNQIFELMRVALIQGADGDDPKQALARDRSLVTALESSLAFGKGVVYVGIETTNGEAIVAAGQNPYLGLVKPKPISALERQSDSWMSLGLISPLWGNQTYELSRPVEVNGKPFAMIKVALSTDLIAAGVRHSVAVIASIGLMILIIGSLALAVSTKFLLRPVAVITTGVEQLTRGAEEIRLAVASHDELGTLADKFNQLARRVKSDRTNWENERGQFFNVFRSITDAVLLLDAHGSLLFANAEAFGRLGLPAGGLIEGKRLNLLLGKDHPLCRLVEAAFRTGAEVHDAPLDLSEESLEGRFLVSIFSLGQGPEPVGLLVILRDLAPVRELESVVDYSGRLARLGGLISGFAHQVRGPLNAMNLQLELLSQTAADDAPSTGYIAAVRSQIRRLEQVVGALMRFMRPEQLKVSDVGVNELLTELGARFASERYKIEYALDPQVAKIRADRGLLTEALTNLIQNGLQAMPNGGKLTLKSELVEAGTVEIAVTDCGCGIAPEHLDQVFNLYFTTKDGGNGLGLPMALRAVDLHHGTVNISPSPEGGTTVKIRLPTGAEDAALATSININ